MYKQVDSAVRCQAAFCKMHGWRIQLRRGVKSSEEHKGWVSLTTIQTTLFVPTFLPHDLFFLLICRLIIIIKKYLNHNRSY